MLNQEEKLREEFNKQFGFDFLGAKIDLSDIADFWLTKLQEARDEAHGAGVEFVMKRTADLKERWYKAHPATNIIPDYRAVIDWAIEQGRIAGMEQAEADNLRTLPELLTAVKSQERLRLVGVLEGMKRKDTDPLHSYMPDVYNQALTDFIKRATLTEPGKEGV